MTIGIDGRPLPDHQEPYYEELDPPLEKDDREYDEDFEYERQKDMQLEVTK